MSAETTAVPADPTGAVTPAEFGRRLQALIHARRRSVESVARRSREAGTPISRATVYNLIAGTGASRRDTLVAFLRGCGVPPREQIRWLTTFDRVHAHTGPGVAPQDARAAARTADVRRPGSLGSAA
ncbi:helix-turn-helix transcriptional regulator [Actinoplanes sp. NPDC049118]|uniref:helix-turn-helix domain-containing protein n=1 Tax=Actinoplanes sp. NPDC049118 TaxID=3155769 RepID=UPI0033F7BC95